MNSYRNNPHVIPLVNRTFNKLYIINVLKFLFIKYYNRLCAQKKNRKAIMVIKSSELKLEK